MNGHRKQNAPFIAVINHLSSAQTHRSGPANLFRLKPSWKLPLNFRRLSRVAGIDPINVPALLEVKQHAYQSGFSRLQGIILGNQAYLCMAGGERLRRSAYGRYESEQENR